ncbi:hypothetical protein C0992_004207 [Termitomyces sp. T32_za158]|nr:hypothetical protein C0992_004207 [Termitomyces sp. T32_za158]
MVSSLLADALADPTAVLNDVFDGDLDAFPAAVAAQFSAIFATPDALTEIPYLNDPNEHKDRALVRFRAMIQDTSPSPEMYLARRTGARCGGWGLSDPASLAAIDYADLRECTVLWAVSVPGESPWCASAVENVDTPQKHVAHTPPLPHKFPVPGMRHLGVQIKVYTRDRVADAFGSTDIHTFVGILTSEPLSNSLELDTPVLVPTLHVLFSQPVPPTIVPRVYPSMSHSKEIRDELIAWIADTSLAGDLDAAEWVLLSIISRVQSRIPPILPLSLTLSRFPSPSGPNTTPALLHVLSQVVALLTTLPLSLETINNTPFAPESKDEDLHSGWLQLPRGSACLVTEGGITEGKVVERGLVNLRALQEAISTQRLEYVFPFSCFAFDTDVTFITLAEGKKSAFFQTDINVPLQPQTTNFDFYATPEAIRQLPQEKLDAFRSLIGAAKVGNMTVGENSAQFIQDDFVKERQAASSTSEPFSSESLIQRMMTARLLALSLHETEITVPIWEAAKSMDMRRKARI